MDDKFASALEYFDRMKNMPYHEKVAGSRNVVKESMEEFEDRICVSCSFGKDSTLVLYLAREVDPNIPVLFANTTIEYPETYRFRDFLVNEWGLNFHEVKAIKPFWKCVKEYGFPWPRKTYKQNKKLAPGTPRCCYWTKEKPMTLKMRELGMRATFLGITWDESYQRRYTAIRYGHKKFNKGQGVYKISPILYWTTEEVWRFMEEHEIPFNPAYERMDRIGCQACTAYLGWREKIAKENPKLLVRILQMMRKMGDPRGSQSTQEEYRNYMESEPCLHEKQGQLTVENFFEEV